MGIDFSKKKWVVVLFLLLAIYSSFLLIKPYINPIVLGFIFSLLLYPLHQKMLVFCHHRANLAAVLTCSLFTIVVLIPLSLMFTALVSEGARFSTKVIEWGKQGGAQSVLDDAAVKSAMDYINGLVPLKDFQLSSLSEQITSFASEVGGDLVNVSAALLGNVTNLLVSFFLMLFVLFFLLRDHYSVVEFMRKLIPLSRSQEDALFAEVENVAKSAIFGSFATAIVQGFLGGIAMYIVGFPGFFWGAVMAFASFIPMIGTALIWVPATIYLLLLGDWQSALFLAVWGIVVIGSADNFLRPILMQKQGGGGSTLIIFFSLIGGLQLFGLAGLIYGPIIFALTVVFLKMYEMEFESFLEEQDKS